MLDRTKKLLSRVKCSILGKTFHLIVAYDKSYMLIGSGNAKAGRVYIQLSYKAPCTKGQAKDEWKGRKWYLSQYMTDDEIIKTVYSAFEACVKHEIMEGFTVDGKVLFNPHINFEELLKISHKEITRS